MATQIIDRELVSVEAIWQAAYQCGIRDALDELATLARDQVRAHGETSLEGVRRRLAERAFCERRSR